MNFDPNKVLIRYIREGYPGRKKVINGTVFRQENRGKRLGVMVILVDDESFGWSAVSPSEKQNSVDWNTGVELAVKSAENNSKGGKSPPILKKYEFQAELFIRWAKARIKKIKEANSSP